VPKIVNRGVRYKPLDSREYQKIQRPTVIRIYVNLPSAVPFFQVSPDGPTEASKIPLHLEAVTRKNRLNLTLAFLLIAGPRAGAICADEFHPVATTADDGLALLTSPLRLSWEQAAEVTGAVAAVAASSLLDRTVRNHLYPWSNTKASKEWRGFGDVGQEAGPILGTIFAIQGWAAGNQKSEETAFQLYESFLLAGGAEVVIKYAVGRERPSATDDPHHFNPNFSDSSFPSGHTTTAFAAATILADQYPEWYVVCPAFAGAGAVGFSRLYANQHWLSDVLGGAILGSSVSHFIWLRGRKKKGDVVWRIEGNGLGLKIVGYF
jgi:membrane-associated phospholipid phosphatase